METPEVRTAVLDDLEWRRMMADRTDLDALRADMAAAPLRFYGGFDPTAPSLHFGNLVLLVTMRRLQIAGHRPIGVVGGATGLVGDPSGRSAERTLHERDVIGGWVERIRSQVERYLSFDGENAAIIVNNLEWTGEMSAIDWLRDVGKHFSVSRMLAKESVAARLEAGGISYTEFSYQVMQALDFLELYRRYGCTLQVGGSDQWGNLTAGVDLIRRVEGAQAHALATPLITRPDGEKFGKSTGSTLWLDPALTSPFSFYQWFVNTDDSVVGTYLRVFSFRSHDEIEALESTRAAQPDAREAQRALAREVTELVHGTDAAARAAEASQALFGEGDLSALDAGTLEAAFAQLPRTALHSSDGLPTVLDLFVGSGLSESRGAARRVVADGGAYVNNRRVSDASAAPDRSELLAGRWLLLRRGRRALAVAEVVEATGAAAPAP
jgi:tyrosyl-tRNA synthetase